MKTIGIVLATFLLAATSGTAVGAAPETEQAAEKEKKICKNEKITGSLTRVRRVCLTQREWDRLAEIARRDHDLTGWPRPRETVSTIWIGMPTGPRALSNSALHSPTAR